MALSMLYVKHQLKLFICYYLEDYKTWFYLTEIAQNILDQQCKNKTVLTVSMSKSKIKNVQILLIAFLLMMTNLHNNPPINGVFSSS